MVRLAYVLVGDAETARDLAADAFARTYEQWRRGRVDHLPSYLRQAVVNRVRDYHRRAERLRRIQRRRHGDDRGAPSVAEGVAMGDAAHRLLAQLPVRERAALVLRYWLDCSDAQVAERLDVRLGTAKSLLRRGTARLREIAQRLDDDATVMSVRDMDPKDAT